MFVLSLGHRFGWNKVEMMTLLKSYGGTQPGTQPQKSNGTTIAMASKISKSNKIKGRRKRVKKSPLKEKVENIVKQQQNTISRIVSDVNEGEWVTYLDAESQCYYEYNLSSGESRWLTWEQSQDIGIIDNTLVEIPKFHNDKEWT